MQSTQCYAKHIIKRLKFMRNTKLLPASFLLMHSSDNWVEEYYFHNEIFHKQSICFISNLIFLTCDMFCLITYHQALPFEVSEGDRSPSLAWNEAEESSLPLAYHWYNNIARLLKALLGLSWSIPGELLKALLQISNGKACIIYRL